MTQTTLWKIDELPAIDETTKENSLTQSERDALAVSVLSQCRAEGITFARRIGRATDTDDYIQICCQAAVEAARRYRPGDGAAFSSYATGWMRNRMLREATATEQAHQMEEWGHVAARPGCGVGGDLEEGNEWPESQLGEREPNAEQMIWLKRLTPHMRRVVYAIVFRCQTPAQVAEQLGMSEKDVKLHVRTAHRYLDKLIKWDDDDDNMFREYE